MSKTVFVTKYALSEGVRSVKLVEDDDDGLLIVEWPGGFNGRAYFRLGKDVFFHADAAIAQAESMRAAAIKSAEKRIAKLRKLDLKLS